MTNDEKPLETVFSEATNEQLDIVWRMNAQAWASPLSIEEHMKRERFLSQQDLTKGGAWRTWVLTIAGKPEEIVASCETFKKTVWFCENSNLRQDTAYGIASVYTNPTYRGKGMGVLLLEKLKIWLDSTGDGNDRGVVSILYSDIGKEYYTKLGWVPFPSDQVVLSLGEGILRNILGTAFSVRVLESDDLKSLCSEDLKTLLPDEIKKEWQKKPVGALIAFWPTYDQASWHFAREKYMAKRMANGVMTDKATSASPQIKGAISETGKTWMYWHYDLVESKLKVQRVVIADREEYGRNVKELALLLHTAIRAAAIWKIERVIVWNPSREIVEAARAVEAQVDGLLVALEERETSSIPSLRAHGGKNGSITWHANEYFAWC